VDRYDHDVLAAGRATPAPAPTVDADLGLVVEACDGGYCGAVVALEAGAVVVEDRHGNQRVFPIHTTVFLLDGRPVRLRRAARLQPPGGMRRTPSGSRVAPPQAPRVARASRIWVEGLHDAELVERVWGDDLRVEGIVVQPLSGIDHLAQAVAAFGPGPGHRLGILVDHLVAGTKETRLAATVAGPHVLITGHPYVDIWQAVRPGVLGLTAWPTVPPGQPWKEGVCVALGRTDPAQLWREILTRIRTYRDLEAPLIGAVERLIDHVSDTAETEAEH
jgi:hypothetical protein